MTWQDRFNQTYIDKAIQYPSNTFFANELSDELLQNYLARTCGSNHTREYLVEDVSKLLRTSLHSVEINKSEGIKTKLLSNNWLIAGNITYYDTESNTIILPTILSTNRILELIQDNIDNPINLQLSIFNFLLGKQSKLAVIAIDRLFSNYKDMPTKLFNLIDIKNYHNEKQIEQLLLNRTNTLQKALNSKSQPKKCANLKWYRKNNKSIPMQCKHYCNVSNFCNHAATPQNHRINKNSIIF